MGHMDVSLNQLSDCVSDLATLLLWQKNNRLAIVAMMNKPTPELSAMDTSTIVYPYQYYPAYHTATPMKQYLDYNQHPYQTMYSIHTPKTTNKLAPRSLCNNPLTAVYPMYYYPQYLAASTIISPQNSIQHRDQTMSAMSKSTAVYQVPYWY